MGDAARDLYRMAAGEDVQFERFDTLIHQKLRPDVELRKESVHRQVAELENVGTFLYQYNRPIGWIPTLFPTSADVVCPKIQIMIN